MASLPPTELVTRDHHQEQTNGNTSCGGPISLWTEEARWATSYSSLDASLRSQPARKPLEKEHQDAGNVT